MTVSVSEGSKVDLDVIVAGGDAFLTRIKSFQTAKAKAEAALAKYNLGKDVVAAMQDVQAREQAAADLVTQAQLDCEKRLADAKKQVAVILTEAHAKAEAVVAKAAAEADALNAQVKEARGVFDQWSASTRAEAEALMAKAVAATAAAQKRDAEVERKQKQLVTERGEAKAALDDANAMRAALNAKLEAIKAAAS